MAHEISSLSPTQDLEKRRPLPPSRRKGPAERPAREMPGRVTNPLGPKAAPDALERAEGEGMIDRRTS
jgi:hypothetical protein